ncbi:hypothetical protein M3P05_15550 [Sansalvadorimonas sp. 2012CJ34-2]|uniref:NusG-like N-terminal domain-containing protein n=1 Tax=Parendozoicomonas callyspongiae TaxID=2942213 RepID=A0ABT0PIW7_9GAMM|nr:transcription termination/antitermination NusG family protein [Sansalvadorimonas sp. 2012CJ34-2]MCL6271339.1 hypothetical protein [Sansalvadorimonas sp. 2012CJ34-2]
MDEWYLLKTRPRQEQRAVDNLSNQGFEPYCPWLKRKGRKPEPLFPGYVFLLFDEYCGDLPWGKVRSTRGVSHFVRFGLKMATISDDLVESIREREQGEEVVPIFKPGQEVTFTDEAYGGAFNNIQGIFLAEKGEDRCIILLNLLNSERKVEAALSEIRG